MIVAGCGWGALRGLGALWLVVLLLYRGRGAAGVSHFSSCFAMSYEIGGGRRHHTPRFLLASCPFFPTTQTRPTSAPAGSAAAGCRGVGTGHGTRMHPVRAYVLAIGGKIASYINTSTPGRSPLAPLAPPPPLPCSLTLAPAAAAAQCSSTATLGRAACTHRGSRAAEAPLVTGRPGTTTAAP